MDREQRARFERAIERKRAEARRRGEAGVRTVHGGPVDRPLDEGIVERERPQGVVDPRTKNSGHGQKTADKWNQ